MKPDHRLAAAVAAAVVLSACASSAPGGSRSAAPRGPDTLRIEVGGPGVDGNYYPAHIGHNKVVQLAGAQPDTSADWINTLTIGDSAGARVHRWHTGGRSRTPAGVQYRLDLWQNFDARTQELLHYHARTSLGGETRLTITSGHVQGTQRLPNGTVNQLDFTLPRRGFPSGAADLIPPAVTGGLREGLVIVMPVWQVPSRNVTEQTWKVVRRTSIPLQGRDVPAWEMDISDAAGTQTGKIWLAEVSPYMVRWDVMNAQGQVVTRMLGEDATTERR